MVTDLGAEQIPESSFLISFHFWQIFIEHLLCARGPSSAPGTAPVLTEPSLLQGGRMTR